MLFMIAKTIYYIRLSGSCVEHYLVYTSRCGGIARFTRVLFELPCIGGVVRELQRENTKRIFRCYFHNWQYYMSTCYQFFFFLDYIYLTGYDILSHFGSILLCNSNPDADR